jgi:hypothetical protein
MAGIVVIISAILGILDFSLKWGILSWLWKLVVRFANLLVIYWVGSVLVVFAISILALYLKLHLLEKYVAMSFKDDFTKDLNKNWDYQGKWELVPGGELSVTESELGGVTKVGHLWKDYSFEFTAVIVNDRIGWIVRAQDLLNCYMIQLTPTLVRPHLRIQGMWRVLFEHEHKLPISQNDPIRIRTEVRGLEVRVYVNDKEIYYNNELFSMKFIPVKSKEADKEQMLVVPAFTTGRVGFRMAGQEHGRFSRCRVRPL